jgi:coenzyme F420-reducing hydrogenase alpha subunit
MASRRRKTRTIKVNYLTRAEGESALHISMRDGEVADLRLEIFEPPRFFEAFLRGRDSREAPDITARICGICPVAYQMSTVHAFEKLYGIGIDPLSARSAGSTTAVNGSRATPCTSTCSQRPIFSGATA